MTTGGRGEQHGGGRPEGSLALLPVPFIFSQDGLLTTGQFIKAAKERGLDIDLDLLQGLHQSGVLLPLYRVGDAPVAERIEVDGYDGANARGWVLLAAADGMLHDPAHEDYSGKWPYELPASERPDRWWNGFVYSPWQLLGLANAISTHRAITNGWLSATDLAPRVAERGRGQALALAALATLYLPRILGRVRLPAGIEENRFLAYRADTDTQELLSLAGFSASDLEQAADNLLLSAHAADPMQKWLKLIRYARFPAWSQMRGTPLDCMWHRVAAEVLLLAHEDLAADGVLDPLRDLSGSSWYEPQYDRLHPRNSEAETLERALADLGLSPHPRVILLVEGKTELHHVSRLLAEVGLDRTQDVRVQACHGSEVNAHLIARYGITPRIGRRERDGWRLNASPTALVIAMDPENRFATHEKCQLQRRMLQKAILEEVRYQGADIGQDDLNVLVSVRTWGTDKYELANFSDDELVPAITELSRRHGNSRAGSAQWEAKLRGYLERARRLHLDIEAPLGQIGAPKDKPELADQLWPALRAKFSKELATDAVTTPVLRTVMDVRQLVAKLAGVSVLRFPADGAHSE